MPSDEPVQSDPQVIEIRLRTIGQLFNTLDPFPFRDKDLEPEAEKYIVEWAEDLPKDQPIRIVVDLPSDTGPIASADLAHAISSAFAARAVTETKALRSLFRDGRVALVIGVAILALSLFLSLNLSHFFEASVARVVQESFIILGWVVIWRPAEMFLYDWLPIVRRRKLYRRLAAANVTVQAAPPALAEQAREDHV